MEKKGVKTTYTVKEKVLAWLRLSRIDHGLMVVLAIITSFWIALESRLEFRYMDIGQIFVALSVGCLSGLFTEVSTFILNDYFNIEEDRINAPFRPLVKGIISRRMAFFAGVSSTAMALLFSLYLLISIRLSTQFAIIVLALALGLLYDYRLKRKVFVNNSIVAFLTALPFIYGATLYYDKLCQIPLKNTMFFLIAFFATFGREVLKGICDKEGDEKVGVKTFATCFGIRVSSHIAVLFFVVAVLFTIPLTLDSHTPPYSYIYYLFIALTDTIFLYSAIKLMKKVDREVAEELRKLTLLGMGLGIISFAFSI
ncbi:MAG: UbiA family prenyltransferase [Thermoproteales archaeon]|nr:UbiA family prenyltransferase [Thermoproteales archaeon]